MVIKEFLDKFKNSKIINFNEFKDISKKCIDEPSKTYEILNSKFDKEMRKIAAKQINEEENLNMNTLSIEEKEHLIAEKEKELWGKVKNGGITAFALITGISLG